MALGLGLGFNGKLQAGLGGRGLTGYMEIGAADLEDAVA